MVDAALDEGQLHTPDNATPIDETVDALDRLVRDGKVREIGCSNLDGAMLDEAARAALRTGSARFVSVQNELSFLRRRGEQDLLDASERHNLAILPFFPLASGMLTGKYERGSQAPVGTRLAGLPPERREQAMSACRFDTVDALEAFATERGHTLLELGMSWLAGLPHLASVIAGATKPGQVRVNVAAVGWSLTDDERAAVDRLAPQS